MIGILSAVSLAWAALRWSAWEPGPVVPLLAFTPLATAGSVILLVALLVGRRWTASVLVTVAVVLLGGGVAPRALPDRDRGPRGGVPLTVMTANMLAGGAAPAAIVQLVTTNDVAVLALQEYTGTAQLALREAGLDGNLPYSSVALPLTRDPLDTSGSALYSRYPLTATGVRRNSGGFEQAYGTVEVPGAGPVLAESAHPVAPHSLTAIHEWRTDLANEPAPDPRGAPRILLGDFNSTLDHAPLRRLIARGYRDAADATGAGLEPTWGPYGIRPIRVVTIDHVLIDHRIGVSRVTVRTLPRSDHRGLVADLWLPRRSANSIR
jgi:hypothetical protein